MSMAIIHKRDLGIIGEEFAAQYLERSLGWEIAKRNWRCSSGEIDIVARTAVDATVLIEVRTRQVRAQFGTAIESIDERKQYRLRRLAAIYWRLHLSSASVTPRVDAIGLSVHGQTVIHMSHLQNVLA